LETEANAKDFIAVMKSKLEGRNLVNVLNMDLMPIPFSYHSNMTLAKERGQYIPMLQQPR
jgi:hypothetical protein